MRFAFAGDRDISVWIIKYILNQGLRPSCLFVPSPEIASHADKLKELCPFFQPDHVFHGDSFRRGECFELLRTLDLDYIIAIHFPYLIPKELLSVPKIGVLNLHPAYLPFNRGWHTPSWAILEDTPIGATLHFMDASIDTGDIVHQKQLKVYPSDTANTLYQRLKYLEFEVFKDAWPSLLDGEFQRTPQNSQNGTLHRQRELFSEQVQRISLNQRIKARDLINRLRALTTNRLDEAAYFEHEGKRYRIQVVIQEEGEQSGA